jgi:hypothetical protein
VDRARMIRWTGHTKMAVLEFSLPITAFTGVIFNRTCSTLSISTATMPAGWPHVAPQVGARTAAARKPRRGLSDLRA